jgi:hypothetical protein
MSNSEEQFTLPAYQEHIDLLKLDGFALSYENSQSDFFQRTRRQGNEVTFAFNQKIAYQSSGNHWVQDLPRVPFCTGFYNDEIWVGLDHGGLQFYSTQGELTHHTLHGKSISDVYIDHQGGMWVTTLYSGIFYSASPYIRKATINAQTLNHITNLVHAGDEGVCIGFNDGMVYRLNSNTYVQTAQSNQTMHSIIGYSPYLSAYIEIHTHDKPRRFELHVGGQIMQLQGDTSITRLPGVSKVVSNIDDELLLAGYWGLFSINKSGNVKLIKTALKVEDAAKAEIGYYVATIKGIYRIDSNGTLAEPDFHDSFRRQPVYLLEKFGTWYGGATLGNGLILFNEDTAFNISSANGLRSNKINHLFTNGGDSLWVCTNAGVDLVIVNKTGPPSVIPVEPQTRLNAKALTVVDDQIYIAAGDGLYLIPLDGINSDKESELFFELTGISVNNTVTHAGDLTRLKHDQNSIQFNYKAVSFTEEPTFRYKLEHLDDHWHTTEAFNIRYHSIPPGTYNLLIEATLPDREHTEKIVVPLRITPAIYNTWWFKIALVLVLGALIYLFFRFNIMQYNRSIVRELLRHLNRRLKREQPRIIFRDQGKVVQVRSTDVLFMQAANNNVEIHTRNGVFHPRMKLGDCMNLIPDKLEYMQIHRSYIVRIDQIDQFDRTSALIGDQRIPVGPKYQKVFVEFMTERS